MSDVVVLSEKFPVVSVMVFEALLVGVLPMSEPSLKSYTPAIGLSALTVILVR